jgi:Ca2+-binding EF-hand superfamily protein
MSAAPLVLLALFALPIDQVSSPQTAPLRVPSQDGRFADMDTNRDGIITRDEWRGSLQSFRVHDWNRDGMLSGDELRVGRWRDGNWEDIDFDPERSDQIFDWTEGAFLSLDHNRDGRITRNEWHYDLETFRRVDRNRDNMISLQEFLGNPAFDDDRMDRFEDLDVNNNGRIERREWHGTRDAFDWLDRNRNGVLSRAEVVGTATVPARQNQFASLDYNRDGAISPNEWHWSRRSFDQRDLNRDGALTRREFDTTIETTDPAVAGGPSEVRIDPRDRWTDTGIYVRAGEVISFNARGTIQMSDNPNDIATPAGSRTGRLAKSSPMPTQSAGALLMRIGSGNPMVVGNRGSITAPATGQLFLGVNDDHLPDNSGEFLVTVNVFVR